MCTPVFIAALFIIARTWKQPRCPSADECFTVLKIKLLSICVCMWNCGQIGVPFHVILLCLVQRTSLEFLEEKIKFWSCCISVSFSETTCDSMLPLGYKLPNKIYEDFHTMTRFIYLLFLRILHSHITMFQSL